MTIKYYNITERNADYPNVGVIAVENNDFPKQKIQDAVMQHLDEYVGDIVVSVIDELTLQINGKLDNGTEIVFDAEETWLYF